MTERLQTILKELDSGTRDSLYNEIFSVEELLSKDDNGVTFLEIIFKKGLSLNRLTKENIKHNIEIAYIYCENDQFIDFFELSEEDLFKEINGKTYFEYFMQKSILLPKQMISVVEKHFEIIDIIGNDFFGRGGLYRINPKLIELITTKNSEGTYLIEKYINNQDIMDILLSLVDNPNIIIELNEKYSNNDLFKKIGEKALLNNAPNGEVFLLYLINKKGIIPEELEVLSSVNIEFLSFIIKNNLYDYIKGISKSVCLTKVESDKTFLEFFLDNAEESTINQIKLSISKKELQLLIVLKNKNKLNLARKVDDSILLESACDVLQLEEVDKNVTLLEYMLDNGCNPLEGKLSISNEEILKILYKKERPDLLLKASEEYLFKNIENDITYFDYILDCVKEEKIKVRLRDLYPYSNEPDLLISYYFSIAKKNMMEYIDELTEEEILEKYGETTLLELLLERDSELTINKILSSSLKKNPKIATILKSKGFEQERVNVLSQKEKHSVEYLEGVQKHLGIGPLLKEGEILLSQLEQLFLSDGRSDKDLIKALVSGYRQSLFVNYELNIKEIKNLIYIKQQNIDKFFYLKDEKNSYFAPGDNSIHCDTISTDVLLHETGHALHYFLTNDREPENYQEVIFNARNNPAVLKRVEQYSKQFHEIGKKIQELVEQRYKNFFEGYYTDDKKREIRTFLSEEITIKKDKFSDLGLSEEQLEEILGEMYTEEEYIDHQKRIFINENCDSIMSSEYGSFIAIGDIIDAIYEGKFRSEELINQHGDKIRGAYGHGLSYYYASIHGFDEMIANFASISKSKDSAEMLELLRTIVGDELYNMLSEFYYQNIVNINVEEMKTGRTIGGK